MKRFTRKSAFRLESLESRRLLSALTVTNVADGGTGSLRAQVAAAHGGDSIMFAPGLAGQTITLTSGAIAITQNLTIEGPGGDGLAVSGNDASRVFEVTGAATHAQIRNLTITRGSSPYGGAVYNNGVLTLSGCTFSENVAIADGTVNTTQGGAVCSAGGSLTVSNCTFFDNRAIGGQVPVYDLDSMVFLGFQGLDASCGAMSIAGGTARIDHSTFVGNWAAGGNGDFRQGVGSFGAISGGQVSNSIVADNYAEFSPDGGFTSLGHNLIGDSRDAVGFLASDLLDADPQVAPPRDNGGPTQTMALLAGSPAINAGDNADAPPYDQRGASFPRIVGGTIDIGAFESNSAAGKTWTGPSTGGDWSTAANWSPSGVPTASDSVSIAAKFVNLAASATVAGLTLIGGARLTVVQNGERALRTSGLTIDATSKLDLKDNDLILHYTGASPLGERIGSAYTGVTGLIESGHNGGAWDGSHGIITSMPGAAAGLTSIGIAEACGVLGIPAGATEIWNGHTVDATTLLLKYTYAGDANLDGVIDGGDYGIIDNFVQMPDAFGYANGDFNYDGVIDGGDYGVIDNNIQAQGVPL